jgi:hypothetical protein
MNLLKMWSIVQGLNNLHGALAGSLTNWVKEDENQVHMVRQPYNGLLDVKGVLQPTAKSA